jgi:hypothetical protein
MVAVPLQSFSSWVAAGGPDDMAHGFVLAFLVFPLMMLVHEAGHASVGLLRTEGLVVLQVGRSPGWLRGRVGRLAFQFSPVPTWDKIAGSARTLARMTRGDWIAYSLAGAAAQLVALAVLVPLIAETSGSVHASLAWAWAVCFLEVALNLVPRQVAGHWSDGAYLRAALRMQGPDPRLRPPPESTVDAFKAELDDTVSRWVVLFTDEHASVRTERRLGMLNGAGRAIGLRREPGAMATARWHALAGWCWRECERGNPERRREAVELAWRRVAQQRLVGRVLAVATAAALASDPDLALGSPGSTDAERRAFLNLAFERLRPPADLSALDEQDRLHCFRYGVALHDVERLAAEWQPATVH